LLTPERAAENGAEAALLDDLLARADFLSLHCPLTSSTRHIIDAAALAKAKPGVILINNGRGGLVDEDALADALESGHVAYAALDVLEVEPPAPGNRLIGMPNVLVTPHMASVSETSVGRLQQMAVDEVIRILDGKPALAPLWR
jgi:phosphoglycerate dehydrogenase-like enzyme